MKKLLMILVALSLVSCGADGRAFLNDLEDGVFLANSRRVSRAATATTSHWLTAPSGAAANLISPATSVSTKFERITDNCRLYDGVSSWDTVPGGTPVMLSTSLQNVQATLTGNSYVFSGLTAGPIFAGNDAIALSFPDADGATVSIGVPAPPEIVDANNHLGTANGLATEFRVPDGTFDVVTVFVTVTAAGVGQSGVQCQYSADTMVLDGTDRTTPLVDELTVAALMGRNWQADTIFVAYHNEVIDTELFRGVASPIRAGRMLIVDMADL